jgi:hypothetical protein
MSDARIDSIESGLPNEVMEVIKNEFINVKKTNWDLLSEDDANNQLLWIQRNSYDKPLRIGVQRNELTNDENIEDYIEEISEYVEEVDPTIVTPQRARIVPFIPRQTSNDDDLRIN